MTRTHAVRLLSAVALLLVVATSHRVDAREVVAFWGFADDFEFPGKPSYQEFDADVDATVDDNAKLQAFRGDGEDLDDNGGGGFVTYTSPTSGIFYDTTRAVKWDDLAGGGDDFAIDGNDTFTVDKNNGSGPQTGEDFGNDALLYITLDGTGYSDFQFRFDIEATPGDLPNSFDVFYRFDGPGGTWFRDPVQNNISLSFMDYTPTADPKNMFADSGVIGLSSLLDDVSTIEILINDFNDDDSGNKEMEIDNFEITANQVPEPSAAMLLALALACGVRRVTTRQR